MPPALAKLVRKRSATHGEGVYTSAPIARDLAIVTFVGPRLTRAQTSDDLRCMQIGPDEYLGPADAADPNAIGDFLNHSCGPNTGFTRGTLTLYALRDIELGEEICWDYSTAMNEPGWSFTCRCGAKGCRGAVRSFCDLSAEERERLRPTSLEYLRRM